MQTRPYFEQTNPTGVEDARTREEVMSGVEITYDCSQM